MTGQLFADFSSRSKTALSERYSETMAKFVVPVKVGNGDSKRIFIF